MESLYYNLEFGCSVGREQADKGVYNELEVKRNALHIKLRQANSSADTAMIRSDMTNIGRDKSFLNAEFELFPNFVVTPPTVVYAHSRCCSHSCGITRGQGRRGNNRMSAGGRACIQAPKQYTLRDILKFTIDNQGYKTIHSQKENAKAY